MRFLIAALLLAVVLAGAISIAGPSVAPSHGSGVLSVLRNGETVGLKECGDRYEIRILRDGPGPLGYTVVECTADFVVLEDVSQMTQVRIPVYAIKSVTVVMCNGPSERK